MDHSVPTLERGPAAGRFAAMVGTERATTAQALAWAPQKRARRGLGTRREELLASAEEAFVAGGIAVSLSALAAFIGVPRHALARQFPSINTLLCALHMIFLERLECHAAKLGGQGDGLIHFLNYYVDESVRGAAWLDHWLPLENPALQVTRVGRLLAMLQPLVFARTGEPGWPITSPRELLPLLDALAAAPVGYSATARQRLGHRMVAWQAAKWRLAAATPHSVLQAAGHGAEVGKVARA